MTHPTKAIYRSLLHDFIRVSYLPVISLSLTSSAIDTEDQLYDIKDLKESLDRVEAVDFHSTIEVDGIRFTPYHAGHVLGAAMYFIEIAGLKVPSHEDRRLTFRSFSQEIIQEKTTACSYPLNYHPKDPTS
jgi:cleavage and polyadenylation specificity factor subunit 3